MENITVSWIGAVIGIIIAVVLIMKKMNPLYSLAFGAIIGSLLGGANLSETVTILVSGTQSVMGTVVRVLAAGIFAGIMMESGAAIAIARTIVAKMGVKFAIVALAIATMVITGVGVFIPVAVLIVSPIAIEIGKETGISKLALLLAMSGGGKAGNIISPNPNTIAAAGGFDVELSSVMMFGFVPALVGLVMAILLASLIKGKGPKVTAKDYQEEDENLTYPSFAKSIVAPIIAIILLMVGPIGSLLGIQVLANISIDSLYVLPIAGVIGLVAMKQKKEMLNYMTSGLNRMTPTILVLIGAGTIGGVITASDLSTQVVAFINNSGVSGTLLAPLSGILMGAATASTSTGVILASGSFGQAILEMGVVPIAAAVMVHTGATVIDHLPHGTYFHVTGDSMNLSMKERFRIVGYETLVGLSMTIVATLLYGF
ncbi:GntP family permease [Vagococcus intermedius]|uniref:GntP family permease n=1 Tax=Vagococcus intermedius TaxID=2991418 RepID=A0AAF0CT79_9ENTE|nr:Na+/H+ antiporter NhaC family protein [Vagococcus intermedius]WEG72402.1 GntP family permease [Vagococcus intermedius]WEG74490.1 GntP family permease [Vagococcus intermedius]